MDPAPYPDSDIDIDLERGLPPDPDIDLDPERSLPPDPDIDLDLDRGLPQDPGPDPEQDQEQELPADPFTGWHPVTTGYSFRAADTDNPVFYEPLNESVLEHFLVHHA